MQTMDHRVRVVTDVRTVEEQLRGLPTELLRGPFQQASWIGAWLAAHAETRPTLALVTVTDASTGAVLFVLPLMLDTRSGVPCWTALDDGVSDYNAPLLAPDFRPPPQVMRRIWAQVRERLPLGDMIFLEKIPERIAGRRNPLLDLARPRPSRFVGHPLALADGLAAVRARYRAGRSLARKHRKLGRRGTLDFIVLSGARAAPHLEQLMRWRERRYDTRPITTDFYRRLLDDGDLARVGMLRLDGTAVAGCYAIVCDGALRLLVTAFDTQWKNWSPGLLAIDEMIGWACCEGLDVFDFTIGSEPYKFDFGVASERLWEIRSSLRLRGSLILRLLGARRLAAGLARGTAAGFARARARLGPVGD